MNISKDERYLTSRVILKHHIKSCDKVITEIGYAEYLPDNYSLVIKKYSNNHKKNVWSVIKLDILKDGHIIYSIYKNYSSISCIYALYNGKDYLITSEDYQGFTIINLTDRSHFTYIPSGWLRGIGWCPTSMIDFINDDNECELVVEGCIWGCSFTTRRYSLSNLDNPDFENYREYEEESENHDNDEEDE